MIFTFDGFLILPTPELYTEAEGMKQHVLSAELNFQMAVRLGVHKLLVKDYGWAGAIYCEARN